jgi:hypothetical protein
MRAHLAIVLALLAIPASAANLLVDGDFEKGLEGWTVWGARPDSAVVHGGKVACVASSLENAWSGASQIVPIPSGARRLVLSGWIQAESVKPGPEDWNKGRLWLDFLDQRDSVTGGWQMVAGQAKGRIPWTRVERVYEVPAGAAKVKVMCALANARGTFRCDDVELVPVP